MKLTFVFVLCLVLAGCVWRGEDSVRFKFQTSGQSLDVVPVYDYVVGGLVLKPATPSDAKIHRDAQNNALVEWRRRGRINYHWRDRAGVPVSEENEYYEIEVLSGSAVVNTYRMPIAQAQPIQWLRVGDTASVIAADGSGSVYKPALLDAEFSVLHSVQNMDGAFVLEYETYSPYNHPNAVYIANQLGDELIAWIGLGASTLYPNPRSSPVVSYAAGDRFSISYVGGVANYYKNAQSDSSPVVYSIPVAASSPFHVVLAYNPFGSQGILNPKLLRFTAPDWTYTAAMQTADGLTPGNPIHLIIYQVSAQVGRGVGYEVTL